MKTLVTILFVFAGISVFAQQQGLLMDDVEKVDSMELQLQKNIEYFRLINSDVADLKPVDFKLPKYKLLDFSNRFDLSLSQGAVSPVFSFNNSWVSPYFRNAEILTSSVRNLSDKFMVGGYSYGANSIFSAPLPNQNKSYFDTYGSTMFVQYKVSKNIKIEAGVSVQQGSAMP